MPSIGHAIVGASVGAALPPAARWRRALGLSGLAEGPLRRYLGASRGGALAGPVAPIGVGMLSARGLHVVLVELALSAPVAALGLLLARRRAD